MKKMELSADADHYTREEINSLREKFTLINAADKDIVSFRESLMESAEGATVRFGVGEESAM